MSEMPNPDDPEYVIPLDNEQLAELGRLMATWSQIDFLLVLAVAAITKTQIGWMLTFCENMMSGARIGLLRKLTDHIVSNEARALAQSVCSRLGKLVGRRNHLIHGIWGYHVNQQTRATYPACHDGKSPGAPVYAKELPELRKKATFEAREIGRLLHLLDPAFNKGAPPHKFFFGAGPPPSWL